MRTQTRLPAPRTVLPSAKFFLVLFLGAFLALPCLAVAGPGEGGLTLMRFPTVHGDSVVFEAHGNLWRVGRAGGTAARLTVNRGTN